ncbi:glycosyltransferase [Marinilabilia rubra]|uniref:Group 1 family glycosyltransferase n=1 Tax=Marinilabilia rubra TaxID=2162893 RepID=A0A2U2B7D4_9BACT|nr:glycosyltransferase [Marinilabilia rubra]PWD98991.1 group 1 family glycosyltransferase [Marinilabilia rubra]
MVVLVFIRQLSVGGAEKQSLLLSRELQKKHKVFLVVWTQKVVAPSYARFIDENNLSVRFLKGSVLSRMIQFWRIIRKEKVTHIFNFLLINNFVGGIIGRLSGVKRIYGGIRNCEIAKTKFFLQRFLHNHVSHKTIFNNQAGADVLSKRGFDPEKITVIHNGIDIQRVTASQEENGKTLIFTAARFLPQKDHYTALKALQVLKERGAEFKYVIAGYGQQEEEIRNWIGELGLNDRTEVKISPDNLPELFLQSNIYLSTSLKEGLSNSIMEALNAGLPVVATNVGDNRFLVKEGRNGFLTGIGDVASLADALENLINDKSLRMNMGIRGYQHLKEKFSTQNFLNQYLQILDHEE